MSIRESRGIQSIGMLLNSLRAGGAENIMVTLSNCFRDMGHRVEMILGRAQGEFIPRLDPRIQVTDLRTNKHITGLIRLARHLKNNPPDVLISSTMIMSVAALFAKTLWNIPTRILVREPTTLSRDLAWQGLSLPLGTRIASMLVPWLYRKADMIIAVSHGVADDLATRYRIPTTKIRTIYSPILKSLPVPKLERPEHTWFKEDLPIVLSAGRLHKAKDYQVLLRAFAEVLKSAPCRLVILGEGPERPALKELGAELGISDQLSMPGFQDNVFPFMQHCSVFVLSSSYEGLPAALIQALACGCRIVATDCQSGPREILREGSLGKLVPTGDTAQMAQAIITQLKADKPVVDNNWLTQFTEEESLKQYLECMLMSLEPD